MSEEELQSLRSETEALEGELLRLKTEADILNRALDNVYREKDRVLDRLDNIANPQRAEADGGGLVSLQDGAGAYEGGEAAASSGAPRTYKVVRGDTLSQIAKNHNTTTDALVRLNPFLRSRPEMMVWESDTLVLPGPSASLSEGAAGRSR